MKFNKTEQSFIMQKNNLSNESSNAYVVFEMVMGLASIALVAFTCYYLSVIFN